MSDFSVFQRNGQGSYLVQFTNPKTGRRTQVSTRTRIKRDALRLAAEIVSGYADKPTSPPSGGPMSGLIMQWHEHAEAQGFKYSRRTATQVRSFLERAGIYKISQLDPALIAKTADDMIKSGLSRTTVKQYVSQVKGVLNWAAEHGHIKPIQVRTVRATARDRRRERGVLTTPQLRSLLSLIVTTDMTRSLWSPAQRASIYELAAHTGLRRGELCSLTVDDVDLKNKTLTVRASTTKNGQTTTLPLSPAAVHAVELALASNNGSDKLYPHHPKAITDALQDDLKDAGIEPPKGKVIDFHAFRGYFITHLIRAGVDIKTVQTLARHSTPTLTLQAYAQTDMSSMAAAVDLI